MRRPLGDSAVRRRVFPSDCREASQETKILSVIPEAAAIRTRMSAPGLGENRLVGVVGRIDGSPADPIPAHGVYGINIVLSRMRRFYFVIYLTFLR